MNVSTFLSTLFLFALTVPMGCSEQKTAVESPASDATKKTVEHPPNLHRNEDGEVVTVEFYNSDVSAKAVAALQAHGKLREILFIECRQIDKEVLNELCVITTLESLSFNWCDIGDADIVRLTALPNVRELWLSHTNVTGKGIDALTDWKSLRYLALKKGISLEQITPLPDLTNITTLEIDVLGARITNLAGLNSLPNLEVLKITTLKTTDEDLFALRHFKKLKAVEFSVEHITDEGVAHLVALPELQVLSLNQSNVTNRALSSLSSMKSLEVLHLDDCVNITNDGLDDLAKIPTLKRLSLVNSGITGEGLQKLASAKNLQFVAITGEVTTSAHLKTLQSSLPECTVQLVKTKF